jgi:hypothetical protein
MGYRKAGIAALAILSATLAVACEWIEGGQYVTVVVSAVTTFCVVNGLKPKATA